MTASVIIATFNRGPLLAECLDHLARQHFKPGDEVIVVDNGSSDTTPEVIRRAGATFPAIFRQLEEPLPGKSRALARALEVAQGEILAFTDDDVDVDPAWLDAIRSALSDPSTALVGGPVTPRWECPAPSWLRIDSTDNSALAAPLGLMNYGDFPAALGSRTLLGANFAIRRDVLARVGGFAPNLGKLRGTLLSGEDRDICERVVSGGFRAVYIPTARVSHWVPRQRMRVRYFLAWFFWSGITNAALEDSQPVRPGATRPLAGVPFYILKRLFFSFAAASAAAFRLRTTVAVERLTESAFAAGYAAKRWRLIAPAASRPVATAGRAA